MNNSSSGSGGGGVTSDPTSPPSAEKATDGWDNEEWGSLEEEPVSCTFLKIILKLKITRRKFLCLLVLLVKQVDMHLRFLICFNIDVIFIY